MNIKQKLNQNRLWQLFLLAVAIAVICIIENILGIGCPIRHFTGIPCAGCGMTRAILSALRLNFHQAFYYHPLFWMVPVAGIILLSQDHLSKKWNRVFWYLFIILFLGVYIFRLINRDPVLEINIQNGVVCQIISFFADIINP